jgi:hypothetical protein
MATKSALTVKKTATKKTAATSKVVAIKGGRRVSLAQAKKFHKIIIIIDDIWDDIFGPGGYPGDPINPGTLALAKEYKAALKEFRSKSVKMEAALQKGLASK